MALMGIARADAKIFWIRSGRQMCLSQRREYPRKSFALILVPFHEGGINCKYIHWRSVGLGLRWFQYIRQHIGRKHVHTRKIVNMLDGGTQIYVLVPSVVRFFKMQKFLAVLISFIDSTV